MSRQTLLILAAAVLLVGRTVAQEAKELPLHPGDTIKLEVKFDGTDSDKIKTVRAGIRSKATVPTNQVGFDAGFDGNEVSKSPSGEFTSEIKIPENAASGDYYAVVMAFTGLGGTTYKSGTDFQLHDFKIDNQRTFTPPHISVKEKH